MEISLFVPRRREYRNRLPGFVVVRNGEVRICNPQKPVFFRTRLKKTPTPSQNFDMRRLLRPTSLLPFLPFLLPRPYCSAPRGGFVAEKFPRTETKIVFARLFVLVELETGGARRQWREEGGPFHGHRLRRRWFKKLLLSHFPEASS